ncbi:hypothetical protein [Kingella oralis]|uniref:Uncharacterized protein n=1 Tax=Kingella oralis ATCC 51147 TaxID=629741 RepID=C4GIX6_9NEIS|nr:hypothetical protein [Kingella oralis]EEP67748.1 hypothetical protein GCWU000324_01998 [Kingella oralis ATCC 51147]QMT43408.1 hypothetical protein H3L93_03460 [Kingella oralis]
MSQAQNKRQAQAECIIAQFAPLTDNPHDTRHEAIRQHQRNTYQRALAAAKQRGLNITAAHKAALQCLKNNLAAYTSSQQQAPFLENPKKPFSEIPEIAA